MDWRVVVGVSLHCGFDDLSPGNAGQIGDHVEEVLVRKIGEVGVLWERDNGGAVFAPPSYENTYEAIHVFI